MTLTAAERERDQAIGWGINRSADLSLQLAAALRVVEAARAWRDAWGDGPASEALYAAIDVWEAGA